MNARVIPRPARVGALGPGHWASRPGPASGVGHLGGWAGPGPENTAGARWG